MALSDKDALLLAQVAAESDIDANILLELAALESDFPDAGIWGAKAELGRRVTAILNSFASRGDAR
jgi:hypothetical protein